MPKRRGRAAFVRTCCAALVCLALGLLTAAQEARRGAEPPHVSGRPGAPVTVEVFNDYQCPPCATFNEAIKKAEAAYGDRVAFVFRNYPLLALHKNARAAAKAAEAAAAQGKFRQMIDLLYERQSEWSGLGRVDRMFASYAKRLRLDPRRFAADYASDRVAERIQMDFMRGVSLNVKGTPTVFLNGTELSPQDTLQNFQAKIEEAVGPPAPTNPPAAPRFEDYPAGEIYKGRPAPVRIDSRRARLFRTRLREEAPRGPNFAGHYTVVVWGCGTGCAQLAVVDARTGRVYFPPVEYIDIPEMEDEQARARTFRLDSKLLVLTNNFYDGAGRYSAHYYLFDRNRFRLLRRAVERRPGPPEDEN